MAAELRKEPGLDVQNVRGKFNELRVEVDGQDVVDSMWYPTPSSIVATVRAALEPQKRA